MLKRILRTLATVLAGVTLCAAFLYVTHVPILVWAGKQLVHSDPLQRADAIAVLAGHTPEREITAADLFLAGFAPVIALARETDGAGAAELRARGIQIPGRTEWRTEILRQLAVPESAVIVVPGIVTSTADESEAIAGWARDRRLRSLIVVTSQAHTGRSRKMFVRALAGTGIGVRVHPTSLDPFRPDDWWRDRVTLRDGLFEWQKVIFYWFRYW
jgi:uncharacterized SAM-binding protein YcdF (DUF218 family)